jgi:hypothetical protein
MLLPHSYQLEANPIKQRQWLATDIQSSPRIYAKVNYP